MTTATQTAPTYADSGRVTYAEWRTSVEARAAQQSAGHVDTLRAELASIRERRAEIKVEMATLPDGAAKTELRREKNVLFGREDNLVCGEIHYAKMLEAVQAGDWATAEQMSGHGWAVARRATRPDAAGQFAPR